MSIADEIAADQAAKQGNSGRARCNVCKALEDLPDSDRKEMEADVLPDKSFGHAAVSRWLSTHAGFSVTKDNVRGHRENHLA